MIAAGRLAVKHIVPLTLLIAAATAAAACNRADEATAATITVQLPPARPHLPKPAFSFDPGARGPDQVAFARPQ
jgi:hypothetical protein